MIYGLVIAGGLVLLLAVFALRDRMGGGERKPVTNTGDGGVPASYVGASDPSSSYPGTSTGDDWDIGDKPAEDCVADDNASGAEQCDTGDSGSDGGGGGGD